MNLKDKKEVIYTVFGGENEGENGYSIISKAKNVHRKLKFLFSTLRCQKSEWNKNQFESPFDKELKDELNLVNSLCK